MFTSQSLSQTLLYPVHDLQSQQSGLINHMGEMVVAPCFDEIIAIENGFFLFKNKGRYGLLGRDGEIKVKAIFSDIRFEGQVQLGFPCKLEDKWGLYTLSDQWLVRPILKKVFPIYEGIYATISSDDDEKVYFDKDGKKLFSDKKEGPTVFSFGLKRVDFVSGTEFICDGNYNYINKEGLLLSEVQYQQASERFSSGSSVVKIDGFYGVINTMGLYKVLPKFPWIGQIFDGYISCHFGGSERGVISDDGKVVWKGVTGEISNVRHGYFSAMSAKSNLWGLFNLRGESIIDQKYSYIHWSDNEMATVHDSSDNYGFIGVKSGNIIPCVFSEFSQFVGELALVKEDDEMFYINKAGEMVYKFR